jgi:uncharacterized membrane protein YgaE (UPF0421/DUF939 family)
MTASGRALVWAPRILGIAVALFIGVFALDALGEGPRAILLHLVPTFVLLLAVFLAWHRPWVGALVFVALAVVYAATVPARPDWILVISGPLLVVGLLFLWSWRQPTSSHA